MIIQFNSARNVQANEALKALIIALLSEKLNRFSQHISRLDVHLSDENESKEGMNEKRCLLEAHLDGAAPLIAKNNGATFALAAEGAADKLKSSLHSSLGRSANHHQQLSKDAADPELNDQTSEGLAESGTE